MALAWILKIITDWWQSRKSDRKILNNILYHFIETYGLLKKLNVENTQHALNKLCEKVPQLQGFQDDKVASAYVSSLLVSIQIKIVFNEDLVGIKTNMAALLLELAKLYPFTALELKNSATIKDALDNIDMMFVGIEQAIQKDMPNTGSIPSFADHFNPFIIENTLKGLHEDTIMVAKKIGCYTAYRAKKELRETTNEFDESAFDQAVIAVQEYIKKVEKSEVSE